MMRADSERIHRAVTVSQALASVNGKLAQIKYDISRRPLVDLPKVLVSGGRFGLCQFFQRRQVDTRHARSC